MSHLPFTKQYRIGNEMFKTPPFVVHEAWKISDNRHAMVKMLCKLNFSSFDLSQIQKELKFWKLVSYPTIVSILDIIEEEAFIYILYEYPEGGDLEAMILDHDRAFTEGFTRSVALRILDSLAYLHSNGIVHGMCLPSNILFYSRSGTPGWVETAKLSSIKTGISPQSSFSIDLRQLAYTLCCLLRRSPGLLKTSTFSPAILSGPEWMHLSTAFKDFVSELCDSHTSLKSAEYFLTHHWMSSNNRIVGAAHNNNRLLEQNTQANNILGPLLPLKSHTIAFNPQQRLSALRALIHIRFASAMSSSWYYGSKVWKPVCAELTLQSIILHKHVKRKITKAKKMNGPAASPSRSSESASPPTQGTLYESLALDPIEEAYREDLAASISAASSQLLHTAIYLHNKAIEWEGGEEAPDVLSPEGTRTLVLLDSMTLRILLWLKFETVETCDRWFVVMRDFMSRTYITPDPVSWTPTPRPEPESLCDPDPEFEEKASSQSPGDHDLNIPQFRGNMIVANPLTSSPALHGDLQGNFNLAENLAEVLRSDQWQLQTNRSISAKSTTSPPPPSVLSAHAELVKAVSTIAAGFTDQLKAQSDAYMRYQALRSLWSKSQLPMQSDSFAPYPSNHRKRVHPGVRWDRRAEELVLVLATGVPLNSPVEHGQRWFLIDATWFRHWIHFLTSSRRMSVPGPVDNMWMLSPESGRPYADLREDTEDRPGDYRRITPQIWAMILEWYGGGPVISVTGAPLEDTTRWELEELPGLALRDFEDMTSDSSDEMEGTVDEGGVGGGGEGAGGFVVRDEGARVKEEEGGEEEEEEEGKTFRTDDSFAVTHMLRPHRLIRPHPAGSQRPDSIQVLGVSGLGREEVNMESENHSVTGTVHALARPSPVDLAGLHQGNGELFFDDDDSSGTEGSDSGGESESTNN